jgi:uncharacterized protein YaaQ
MMIGLIDHRVDKSMKRVIERGTHTYRQVRSSQSVISQQSVILTAYAVVVDILLL